MKITIKATREVEVKYLKASCGVRYWEDATVNGVEDTEGTLIPCRVGDRWEPVIDIITGTICGWPPGTTADIHYKVCDDGEYYLLGPKMGVVQKVEGYVPDIMCPKEDGFGDYVIMIVRPDGVIENWDSSSCWAP